MSANRHLGSTIGAPNPPAASILISTAFASSRNEIPARLFRIPLSNRTSAQRPKHIMKADIPASNNDPPGGIQAAAQAFVEAVSADLAAKVERLEGLIEKQQRNEVKAAPESGEPSRSKASSGITDADVEHRTDLAAREAALKKGEEKLRTEKALLAHEKGKFERSQRGASKRAPEFLEDLNLDEERDLVVGPSRKRLRTDTKVQANKISQLFKPAFGFPDRDIREARWIPFSFKERAGSPAFRRRSLTPPNGDGGKALFGSRTRA
ncbi:hypothetical protein C8R45DRAFT_1192323 [Mycena sanguinolenta]|nr:hypothetical protein C8R45DRAFT_1192323 [Mycena sanguinolenta]